MAGEPLDYLCEIFGSAAELARGLGVDRSLVTRWRRNGRLPTVYNGRLIEAAEARGILRSEVAPYLDPHVCPCCGSALEPGQAVDVSRRRP